MSSSEIKMEITYNQDLEPLERLLAGVRRAGDFYVHGTMEMPMPKVEVNGVGVLSFPVPEVQACALIRNSIQAPYGRGTETIVDPNVRRVWQLSPDQARIGGKSWPTNLEAIMNRVIAGLGCDGWQVSAELYKLLIYDQGGFFVAHRDTEKADGMFGTLVVVLPSDHRGGELVIRHAGREVKVDLAGMETSEVGYVAFYADCEHEVRPITDGYRVCLVYNLIQTRAVGAMISPTLRAPDRERETRATAALLGDAFLSPNAPIKIAWLLEHQYSPDGLRFSSLKSTDRARAEVLLKAAELAGCIAHLGIVHLEQSGSAEPSYAPYHHRRRRFEDDDMADREDGESFEVVEVLDSSEYVDQWRDALDQPMAFGSIPLESGELLPVGALNGVPPDKQRLIEATGNEGASFERSYHRAAVVIWLRDRYADVLLQAGAGAALPLLKQQLTPPSGCSLTPEASQTASDLARRILAAWPPPQPSSFWRSTQESDHRTTMLELLAQLGDVELLSNFIENRVLVEFNGCETRALIQCTPRLGSERTGTLFALLMSQQATRWPGACILLLKALSDDYHGKPAESESAAFRKVAAALTSGLSRGESNPQQLWRPMMDKSKPGSVLDANGVATLFQILDAAGAVDLAEAATCELLGRPDHFDPLRLLTPALGLLGKPKASGVSVRVAGFNPLWVGTVEFLLKRSEKPPAAPRDWRQAVKLDCNCTECREMQAFVSSSVESVHRFRVRQERRNHLEGKIAALCLEMDAVTDRSGSPQTLVCTKNRRNYQRRCSEYQDDLAALALLAGLQDSDTPSRAAALKRIAAARSLADKWSPLST